MSLHPQYLLDVHDELIVDLFAGGGGASSGIEQALGRMVDIAINHDPVAVGLHKANHPQTVHYTSDVFEVDPRRATDGRPVGLLWASPDCTYHSKARGSKPIRHANRRRRSLAWVVTRWAGTVMPRVIILENVEEFAEWGPLIGKPDKLRPCAKRRGKTFRKWVSSLKAHGYQVECRELRACDYGAPTTRKRLFVIARRDGRPIVWPEPSHGPGRKKPFRTAAECIDWSLPMCSIFATKEEAKEWAKLHGVGVPIRPLADKSLARIARGVKKFVLDNPKPFIVQMGQTGSWSDKSRGVNEPLSTITTKNSHLLATAHVSTYYGGEQGADRSQGLDSPIATITSGGGRHALVAGFLAKHYGGFYDQSKGSGATLEGPLHTICANGRGHQTLVGAYIGRDFGESVGNSAEDPIGTITSTGNGKASLVAAFLAKYFGTGDGSSLSDPSPTVTTKDRFGLVTVEVNGENHVLTDIAMRMLTPRELFRAQGFRDSYIIDRQADGTPITKTDQVRLCGNSVSPAISEALAAANCVELIIRERVPA